ISVWSRSANGIWRRRVLEAGLIAAGLGVFLSASRMSAILLAVSMIGVFTSLRLKASHRAGIVVLLLVVAWIVGKEERLQRFTTLADTDFVVKRIGWSVNYTFVDVLMNYPMVNGLGGGGTRSPYFLQDRLHDPAPRENKY